MLTASATAMTIIDKLRIGFLLVLGFRDALLSSTRSKPTTRPAGEQGPPPPPLWNYSDVLPSRDCDLVRDIDERRGSGKAYL